jgi:hypothetical protein
VSRLAHRKHSRQATPCSARATQSLATPTLTIPTLTIPTLTIPTLAKTVLSTRVTIAPAAPRLNAGAPTLLAPTAGLDGAAPGWMTIRSGVDGDAPRRAGMAASLALSPRGMIPAIAAALYPDAADRRVGEAPRRRAPSRAKLKVDPFTVAPCCRRRASRASCRSSARWRTAPHHARAGSAGVMPGGRRRSV